jgi:hypothetical protein
MKWDEYMGIEMHEATRAADSFKPKCPQVTVSRGFFRFG